MQNHFSSLAEKWPSSFVARDKVSEFSGGIINPRTIANHDCKGTGPAGRFRVGRKIAYPVQSLVEWLEARSQSLGDVR